MRRVVCSGAKATRRRNVIVVYLDYNTPGFQGFSWRQPSSQLGFLYWTWPFTVSSPDLPCLFTTQ